MTKLEEAKTRYKNRQKNKVDEKNTKTNSSRNSKLESAKKRYMAKTINFDTFQSDLSSMGKTIEGIYGGWQTQETMNNTRASVETMRNRINAYQEYRKLYGGDDTPDLTDLANNYSAVLDDWDERAKAYGKYKDADSYTKAMKDAEEALKYEEGKKTADLGKIQSEIDILQTKYDVATKHENNIQTAKNKTNNYEGRSRGASTDGGYAKRIEEAEAEYEKFRQATGFNNAEEIKAQLEEKKQYKNSAKLIQDSIALADNIRAETDFDVYVAKGEALGEEKEDGWLVSGNQRKNTVAYLRNNPEAMETFEKAAKSANGASLGTVERITLNRSLEYKLAKYGTKEQIENYYAYLGKDDEENAEKYLKSIEESLNIAMGTEIAEEIDSTIEKLRFGSSAGFDQFEQGMINLFNGSDEYIPSSPTQFASAQVRESLEDVGPEVLGSSIGQGTYDLITTTTNMAPAIATSYLANAIVPGSGAVVGAALMGSSAAGNAYQEKLNAGWDKSQARTYSTVVGISEAGLQYAMGGIGKLGGKITGKSAQAIARGIDNAAGRFALTYGSKLASEGLEEALQEVLTPFFENLALGYSKNDLSDIEWEQVAYSGMLGALSAGFLEGGSTAVDVFGENHSAKGIGAGIRSSEQIGDMLDIASLTPQESAAYDLYTRYANKGVNAENVSDLQLGRLYVNAEADARGVLSSKKSTLSQQEQAKDTIKKLSGINAEKTLDGNTISKIEEGVDVSKQYRDGLIAEGLESAENTESHKLALEYKARLENGEDISTKELSKLAKANDNAIKLEEYAQTMSEEDAGLFVEQYDGTMDVEEYHSNFTYVNVLADNAVDIDEALSKSSMTPSQIGAIYNAKILASDTKPLRVALDNLKAKHKGSAFVEGSVNDVVIDYRNTTTDGSKVNWKELTSRQRKAIRFAKAFAKATGVNIMFTRSKVVDGKHKGENGSYNPETNTITLDVYAGRIDATSTKDAIIPTLSHELTHWMKYKAPDIYKAISEEVMQTLDASGKETRHERITREIDRLKKAHQGKDFTSEDAMDEIVARACEDMLSNSNKARKLLSKMSVEEQQRFVDKVKETLENLIGWVNELLLYYKSDKAKIESEEAKTLREYKSNLKRISKMWDDMLVFSIEANQALQKEGTTGEKLANKVASEQYSIREEYANEIEEWVKDGKPNGETFILGTTGDVLQGLGAIESDIYMLSSKINEILSDHPEITIDEIKKIPQVLENPVLILKSQNVGRNSKHNTRMVVFGTVKAKNEKPMLAVLDLRPIEKNLVIEDMQKVSSAYTKETNPIDFVRNSLVVYADKKITTKLLSSIGFQMPIEVLQSGYIGSISYYRDSVKINGEEFSKIFKENAVQYSDRDTEYLELAKNPEKNEARLREMVDEAAKEADYNVKAYHGTSRADRVGNVFLPERATSGPMAYFTDNKEIASNYARDKADTSLAYDVEYDSYYTQFRVNRGGKSISIPELWKYLSITQKNKIRELAGHIKFDDDYENIIVEESAKHGNGAYDAYTLNMHRGNVLETLVDTWLETGDLYNREADFLEVLRLVGIEDVEYRDPDARQEKVYDTWLKIQNPFDTEFADNTFYDSLSNWIETHDMSVYEKETSNADMWDKNNQTPETWLEKLNDDIENGTTHAWTVIPDFVTDYLKEQHYDGIKDKGGKGGGEGHTVWIPFSSEQIKSAEPVTYDDDGNVIPLSERFNEDKNDIRYSDRDYSYNEIVAKDDLKGIVIDKNQQVKLMSNGSIDAGWIVSEVKKKCEELKTKSKDSVYYTNVPDIERNVEISNKGIIHSFFSSVGHTKKASQRDLINARVSLEIPQILKNSIEVNRSVRGGNVDVPYSHIMMGTVALEDANGNLEYYAVRSVIEERVNQNPILAEAEVLGKLYAINAKKVGTPNAQVTKNGVALTYDVAYTYNIAQFLEDVKVEFDDTFSEDVYKRLGMARKENNFSQYLQYSDRAYMEAVNNGDMETAQRMVDEAAESKFHNSKVRDANGKLLEVYHGRVSEFTVFDRKFSMIESDLGKGFYFTSNEYDVEANYANEEGPDLKNKISRYAERLEFEDEYSDLSYEEREEIARQKFITSEPNTISAYLNMENPVYLTPNEQGTLLDYSEEYDEENDEYGEPEGLLVDFVEALNDNAWEFNSPGGVDYSFLYEDAYAGGIYAADAVQKIKNRVTEWVEDDEGNIAINEVIRLAFEQIGFDGIIDSTVSYKFRNMSGMDSGTTHYIVFDSNQIKSSEPVTYDDEGNVIPLSERFNKENNDIRYSDRDNYAYEAIVAKPDMKLTILDGNVPNNRADIIYQAKKNAAKVGTVDSKNNMVSVFVDDVGRNVVIGTDGLKHGLRRIKDIQNKPNSIVTLKAGEILKNSIKINELTPSKEAATGSYVLIGAAKNNSGDLYIVRSVVNEFTNELASIDVLYAVNTKIEPAVLNAPRYAAKPLSVTDSIISIADLLDYVNKYFPDVLPEGILAHYGHNARPDGELGESTRFSDRPTETIYDKMGETERLQKENEKLKADIDRLRERLKLEGQVTKGDRFDKRKLELIAGHLRKLAKSTTSNETLVPMLEEAFGYMTRLDDPDSYNGTMRRLNQIAETLLEEAKPETVSDAYAKMILRDIRGKRISLSETQVQEAKHIFGDNYRNAFWGKVTIAKDGISLDSQWQEWARQYPAYFDANVSEADQIGALYDIFDGLRELSEMAVEYDMAEKTRWLGQEVLNQFWNLKPIETVADKYEKRIKELNFEHRKTMTELRDDYTDRMAEQKKEIRQKTAERLKELRERKDKEIAEVKKLSKERMDKYKENAERKTVIQRITGNALTLNKWLTKNSKDYHIHEVMKGPVIKLLNAIDFSSKRMLEKGEPTQKDVSFAEAFSEVKEMLDNATNMVVGLEELYGHDLTEDIKRLATATFNLVGDNNYIINAMSNEELQSLDKLVRHIKKVVSELNKFHTVHHAQGAISLANELMEHGEKLGNLKKQHGEIGKFLQFRNRTPYYFFKDLGEAGKKLFEAFQDGWDKLAFNVKKIIDFTKETYTAKEAKKWSKETKEFKVTQLDGSERTFEMSIAQIMALHCVSKQDDAKTHLLSGGMTLKRFDKKGKVVVDYDNISLTITDIQSILETLTDRQRKVADKLQEFMNTVCSAWGNEISMARFGVEMFGIPDYFPIKVSEATVPTDNTTDVDNASLFRLLNMSFTKARNQDAKQSIEIGDIFDIFAQHSSDMAKYNALALPVLDFNKFYSIHGKNSMGKEYGVVKTLKSVFGDEANGYLRRFVRDLNGSQNVSRDVIGNTFFKNAKVAAVAANLRVVLLQPTAFYKASAILDNKYLIKAGAYIKVEPIGMVKKLKKAIANAEKYCGIAQWKSLGYYDTDISKGLTEKIKHAETAKDKVVEWTMKGAEIADKVTFGTLWVACEFEIRDTRKDLKVGSEEFYDAVAKRLREVIYATQVVDSTMTRSDMMRSPDGKDKMLTAFGSEPIIAYNMLLDVVTQYNRDKQEFGKKEARKRNFKKARKVLVAYVVTNAMAALIESGFDALRDDDDEEMDVAEFMKLYLKNFAFDMSIGNKLPVVKEVYSLMQGYSSSRMDTQWMTHMVSALTNWNKVLSGKGKMGKTIRDTVKFASELFGLPFYNAYREIMTPLNKLDIFTSEDLEEMFKDFFD